MIDAHVHLWQLRRHGCTWPTPDLAAIHRDFTLDELSRTLEDAGVDGAILVQSQEDPRDTEWLLSVAAAAQIAAVIGWTDLTDAAAPSAIARLAAHPKLRGLRPMVQGREDDWYDLPEIATALGAMAAHGLVLDALIQPRHLPALHRLAVRHPQLQIVVDHAAKPQASELDAWRAAIAQAAACPTIACKLSGLLTEVPEPLAEPVFSHLWQCFGSARLLWGSDWPVLTLAGTYAHWLALARGWVPAEDHAAVFGENARRIYRLA